jgi:hypothetical protein
VLHLNASSIIRRAVFRRLSIYLALQVM